MKKPHISFLFTICLALSINLNSAYRQSSTERPCNLAFRCTLEGPGVWATDDEKCFVFRNSCHMASVNCNRANEYKSELKELPKEECQKRCTTMCPYDTTEVCGELNGNKRDFSNQCTMDAHICQTGELYSLYSIGKC